MSDHFSKGFLRTLRNEILIDNVVVNLLKLEVRMVKNIMRFRCPLCHGFHTATNRKTNLARCFECKKNFNPIDLVMTVGHCNFVDAVNYLKDSLDH